MAATALMLASSCSNDDVQVVNQGTEITFNTQVSRATEINLGNLKGFRVWVALPKDIHRCLSTVKRLKERR